MNKLDTFILNILNLNIDQIISIESYQKEGIVFARIVPKTSTDSCPYCGNKKIISKGYRDRKIKTMANNVCSCEIIYRIKRFTCKSCNVSFSDEHYIAPCNSRSSYYLITNVMNLLKNPEMTFKLVSTLLNVSSQTVIRIFDHYCKTAHITLPEVICIDEVYTKNSDFDNSKYSCLIYDFYNKTLVDVTPSRKKEFLLNYLEKTYSQKERNNVKIVSIDMYITYKNVAKLRFKNAIICVDSFHVIKALNDCVQNVRMRIIRLYETSSIEYYLLKQFKFLFLSSNINLDNYPRFNKRLNQYINYRGLLELILKIHPDLKKSYDLKEAYILFNQEPHAVKEALISIHDFYNKFLESDIVELMPFVTILGNWDDEIANSFTVYKNRRISSGVAESINSKVSSIIYNSRGIRNSERRKKRIMYVVNNKSSTL